MNKIRQHLLNILLVFFSLAIFIVMAEITARLFWQPSNSVYAEAPDSLGRLIESDPILETRYKPLASKMIYSQYGEFSIQYATNEFGFRDRVWDKRESNTPYKILVLGNSFVEGWGVNEEQTFLRIAEGELSKHTNQNIKIYNAGMSGYGAIQNYLVLKQLLPIIKPDMVIFNLVGTMVYSDHRFSKLARFDNDNLAIELEPEILKISGQTHYSANALVSFINKHSQFYKFIHSRLQNHIKLKEIKSGDPTFDLFSVYRPNNDPNMLFQKTLHHIYGMKIILEQNNIPFYLVLLPLPFQLSSGEWEQGRDLYGLFQVAPETEISLVKKFSDDKGINLLYPHKDFQEYYKGNKVQNYQKLFYNYDFHLNKKGHEILGKWYSSILAKHLKN